MRFGLCINTIRAVETVKKLGFDAYEFSGAALAAMPEEEFSALRSVTERLSFPCLGLNALSSGDPAFVGPDYSLDRARQYIRALLPRAAALGAKNIGVGAPKARSFPEGFPRERALAQLKGFLEMSAGEAAGFGMSVLIEQLRPELCNTINTVGEALALGEELGWSDLHLVFDFYHVHASGEPAIEKFIEAKEHIAHVHLSTDEAGLSRGYPLDNTEYGPLLRAIKEAGYDGTVSIEPSRFLAGTAQRSVQMLRRCVRSG